MIVEVTDTMLEVTSSLVLGIPRSLSPASEKGRIFIILGKTIRINKTPPEPYFQVKVRVVNKVLPRQPPLL